jgi:protocatechuate 3,4-dioxygenase beta subunit
MAVVGSHEATARVLLDSSFAPGEVAEVGDLVLAPAHSIQGRVLNAMGQPVDHARVVWESAYGAPQQSPRFRWLTTTGPDGRYELGDIPPGNWTIAAGGIRLPQVRVRVEVEEDLGQDLRLPLTHGPPLTLRVLDSDARPIEGIRVEVWDARGGLFTNRYQPLWGDDGVTDASGEVRFSAVPVGACLYQLRVPETPDTTDPFGMPNPNATHLKETVEMAGASQEVVIDMSQWPTLTGRLTGHGEPIAEAHVMVYNSLHNENHVRTQTDAAGTYSLRAPVDTYGMAVSLGTTALWSADDLDLTEDRVLDIELGPGN